jgi:hypothetical protein
LTPQAIIQPPKRIDAAIVDETLQQHRICKDALVGCVRDRLNVKHSQSGHSLSVSCHIITQNILKIIEVLLGRTESEDAKKIVTNLPSGVDKSQTPGRKLIRCTAHLWLDERLNRSHELV